VFFCFKGGDRLKFGDVVMATASIFVIYWLLYAVLMVVSLSMIWGIYVATYVSPLLSAIVVGYVFAGKIREESRMRSIGKIVVLSTVLVMLVYYMSYTIGHTGAFIDESLGNLFSTGSWTTLDWVRYETMYVMVNTAAVAVFAALLDFIGLYAGSMLKKQKKA
jgi:hypothetical protein